MISDTVGERVAQLRRAQGISREDLAALVSGLGWPMGPAAVTNLESGRRDKETGLRRREITVDELLVLARALRVPPILLLYPFGEIPRTEIAPGVFGTPWAGVKWFSGETDLDGVPLEDDPGAAPLVLYRRHESAAAELANVRFNAFSAVRDEFSEGGLSAGRLMYALRHGRAVNNGEVEDLVAAALKADPDLASRHDLAIHDLQTVRGEMRRLRLLCPDPPAGSGIKEGTDG